MGQHSGTEQEQRACSGNVQRFCRSYLIRAISLCWPALNNIGQARRVLEKSSSRITVSEDNRANPANRALERSLLPLVTFALQHFPRILRISCSAFPSE